MKTQIPLLILLSFCPIWASEPQTTALFIPNDQPTTSRMTSALDASVLCAACGAQICEQCVEKNQTRQSMVSHIIEEQHRAIALQQKTMELQNQKINALHSELHAAAMQRKTMILQQDIMDIQLAQIDSLHHQLQLYESNQQEIEQLRQTVAELKELLVPLQQENENRFNLMAQRSAALQELAEKKIPVQHALLATLAEVGRGKRDAIWYRIVQPQHFISKTLTSLTPETKEALKAWISLP